MGKYAGEKQSKHGQNHFKIHLHHVCLNILGKKKRNSEMFSVERKRAESVAGADYFLALTTRANVIHSLSND